MVPNTFCFPLQNDCHVQFKFFQASIGEIISYSLVVKDILSPFEMISDLSSHFYPSRGVSFTVIPRQEHVLILSASTISTCRFLKCNQFKVNDQYLTTVQRTACSCRPTLVSCRVLWCRKVAIWAYRTLRLSAMIVNYRYHSNEVHRQPEKVP